MIKELNHSPLLQAIVGNALESPEKSAIIATDDFHVSYSDLIVYIGKAAAFLTAQGITRGDRIMISAKKEVEFIYFYFASHLLGAVNVVVDAGNSRDHIEYISSVVKPTVAIGVEVNNCKSFKYGDIDLPNEGIEKGCGECSENDAADIMFTSGTTGKPKGVMLSHFNIFSSAQNINGFIGNGPDEIEFLGLPVCHSFGLGRMRCNLIKGSTIVLHNGFANLKSVFDVFSKYGVTGFGMVPAIWAYIKKFSGERIGRFSEQIRYIEIGSAAMPLEDKKQLLRLFPDTRICMHYGLTEASRAVFMEFHENEKNLSTAGKPVSEKVDIRIIDESGREVAYGMPGEVCVRGNMVTNSYYLSEDNVNAFIDGYFKTGDWGYLDEDGRLYLVARKKELINVGGKKVSPIEIEEALSRIGVGEAMCVAEKDPDGILGEVPKVMLVKGTFTMTIDEIREKLRVELETYKLPVFYEIVDSIPKTESGKKKRT